MISFSGDIGDNRYGAERARCEMGVCVCVCEGGGGGLGGSTWRNGGFSCMRNKREVLANSAS